MGRELVHIAVTLRHGPEVELVGVATGQRLGDPPGGKTHLRERQFRSSHKPHLCRQLGVVKVQRNWRCGSMISFDR